MTERDCVAALSNRASDSGRAQKELGYAPAPARVALAKAAQWFLDAGMCRESARRRVRVSCIATRERRLTCEGVAMHTLFLLLDGYVKHDKLAFRRDIIRT